MSRSSPSSPIDLDSPSPHTFEALLEGHTFDALLVNLLVVLMQVA